MSAAAEETLDEALIRLQGKGPEFEHGLSNHGPMACEALVRLGRADAVGSWLDGYIGALEPGPAPGRRLGPDDHRSAIGNPRRYPDLLAAVTADLEEAPWTEVAGRWIERLLPGVSAAALHGVIRTAHAVRSLEELDSAPRRGELASGLAYWGSAYEELPGSPSPSGSRTVAGALENVPRLPPERRIDNLITDDLRQVVDVDGFGEAVDSLAQPPDIPSALSDLTRVMAGWYLANAEVRPIAFVHGVTGPAALRLLLPHLSPASRAAGFGYVWQVCAALCSTCADFSPDASGRTTPAPEGSVSEDQDVVVERAVAAGGAHAIKLVEACLREDALSADRVYSAAAADGARRMRY